MNHEASPFPEEVLPASTEIERARNAIHKSLGRPLLDTPAIKHQKISLGAALDSSNHENDNKFHLLLCASGSVATIKLPLIAKALSKHAQISIRIILTPSAAQFLQGQSDEQPSLQSIAELPNVHGVYQDADEWAEPWTRGAKILHIELRRWADLMVVAPLSANTLAKMAAGLCDGLLLSVMRAWDFEGALATRRTVTIAGSDEETWSGSQRGILVAPAMNTAMWHHPLTSEHLARIERLMPASDEQASPIEVLRPVEKTLACGDAGSGAMIEWKVIVRRIESYFSLNTSSDHEIAQAIDSAPAISKVKAKANDNYGAGIGLTALRKHLEAEIAPGLNSSSQSPRYYGFVTGGATPAARIADNIVTEYDQNVQVHLPNETIATDVEYHTLNMLCELIGLEPEVWTNKTFTTGATASNIMGLACAREYVVEKAAKMRGQRYSVAEQGLAIAGPLTQIQILTTAPHSSIRKAAAIIGLGHNSVVDCSCQDRNFKFDLDKLKKELGNRDRSSIIMLSCCEVNAGMFVTENRQEMMALRELADEHGAWIHADAAMGFMARVLSEDKRFEKLRHCVDGLELCDSITGDGHKLLNVPYDTGFFLSRHLDIGMQVFQNPNAAYLSSADSVIPSPLHVGMENSRRFRALPVYANLVAYGGDGYADMITRQIELARMVATYLLDSPVYELYQPDPQMSREEVIAGVFMIVMFRAKDPNLNEVLVKKINGTRRIYVTGTKWGGRPATRIAVANWQCDPQRDFAVIRDVLQQAGDS